MALSPLTTLTRMLIDTFGGIPVESPASSSTPGPPAVWGDETHSLPREELCALLGRNRATLLERLGTPRSTSELAGDLALAVSTVSEHLRALEAMGLVARGRTGQYVLYRRTERAQRLLALY